MLRGRNPRRPAGLAPATTTTTTTTTSSNTLPGCDPSNYNPQKCPYLPGSQPVAYGYDDTVVRPETYYYHPDHLGSTSWVTDQNGKVHEHVEYYPYGEAWWEPKYDRDGAAVKGQQFLFTSKELDEETGLYYFGARYYDPRLVRWANTDPAYRFSSRDGTKPLNLYQYGLWNPLRIIDPDGRQERTAQKGSNDRDAAYLKDAMRKDDLRRENIQTLLKDLKGVEPPVLLPPPPSTPKDALKTAKDYVIQLYKYLKPFVKAANRAEAYNGSSPAPAPAPGEQAQTTGSEDSAPGVIQPAPPNGQPGPSVAPPPRTNKIYSYIDGDGVYHFTNVPPPARPGRE